MTKRIAKLFLPVAALLLLAACGGAGGGDDGGGGNESIAGTLVAAPGYTVRDISIYLCEAGSDCMSYVDSIGPITSGRTEYFFEFTGLRPGRYDLMALTEGLSGEEAVFQVGAQFSVATGSESVWLELIAIEDDPVEDTEAIMRGVIYLPGGSGAGTASLADELSVQATQTEGEEVTVRAFAAGDLDLLSANSLNSNVGLEAVPGEVIVTFEPTVLFSQSTLGTLSADGVQLQHVQGTAGGLHLYEADSALDPVELAAQLRDRPDVATATPNWILHSFATPNDELYDLQWHLSSINMERAWDVRTGSPAVTVAILDSGSISHPDLTFTGGYDFISTASEAGDGNGRDPDPTDVGDGSGYHGAHVAGTVGARSNNGTGVTGVSWNVPLQPIRVLGREGRGSTFDILDGAAWAAGRSIAGVPNNPNPARIVNMSLGANAGATCAEVLGGDDSFFQNLYNQYGTIFVVAAGNDNANTSGVFPANCPGVITVGATGPNNTAAPYSNFGTAVDVFAPGGDLNYSFQAGTQSYPYGVLSPLLNQQGNPVYAFYQGTSMAAPHVAGVVALLLAEEPGLSLNQIIDRLQSTASRSVSKGGYSAGLIDAAGALTAGSGGGGEEPPPPPPPPPPSDVKTYVMLSRCDDAWCDTVTPEWFAAFANVPAGGQPYRITGLTAGSYYVEGWQDLNGNSDPANGFYGIDANEPRGQHPGIVRLQGGQTTSGIDISLFY